ncbi:hypothetical protein IJ21_14360 [Paenibacillus sp. 32O-W]|jgi:hypothetical protein|nr:hypothetical protein IJ21_14360 [Paenibacillus sp. 32O-W]
MGCETGVARASKFLQKKSRHQAAYVELFPIRNLEERPL